MSICIPHETAIAFESKPVWSNAGLVFDRFAPDTGEHDNGAKKAGLEQVRDTDRLPPLRAAMRARWLASVNAVGAKRLTMKTDWRFVSGVGRNTPYEVGFRFDRYGFATLPGSSVKGIARAYACAIGQDGPPDFIEVFGYAPEDADDKRQAQTGRAIFFDAMPVDDPELVLDVMTPHYPKYYNGTEKYPTDWQSPVPIYFLTVKSGVRFEFAVGWRGKPDDRVHQLALDWLKGGLAELGAGAKTNAGYGYFVPAAEEKVAAPPPPPGPRIKGEGILQRENKGTRIYIQDGDGKYGVLKANIPAVEFSNLPADKTAVIYEYDEVDGKRRVVSVKRKPKGLWTTPPKKQVT